MCCERHQTKPTRLTRAEIEALASRRRQAEDDLRRMYYLAAKRRAWAEDVAVAVQAGFSAEDISAVFSRLVYPPAVLVRPDGRVEAIPVEYKAEWVGEIPVKSKAEWAKEEWVGDDIKEIVAQANTMVIEQPTKTEAPAAKKELVLA